MNALAEWENRTEPSNHVDENNAYVWFSAHDGDTTGGGYQVNTRSGVKQAWHNPAANLSANTTSRTGVQTGEGRSVELGEVA